MLNFFKKNLFSSNYKNNSKNFSQVLNFKPEAKWMKREYKKFADEAFCKNVIAHRSITLIARAAASVQWQAAEVNQYSGSSENLEYHPILGLLKRPNPINSGVEFFETIISYLMIAGNSYINIIKNSQNMPTELYILRPDRVSVLGSNTQFPIAYSYKSGQKESFFPVNQTSGKSDIMHLKHFNPLDDFYGLSPIEAAAYSIDQHNHASHWNQALLQNGARPSGALVVSQNNGMGGNLTSEQYDRLKEQIEEEFSGYKNAGKPLLLEGGIDWKEMSLTNKDIEFLEAKNSAAREIALAFGVPPQLLGIPGDNTYSNLREARLALWEETIFPLLDYITDEINHRLAPMYKGNVHISYNKDNISALSLRRETLWQKIENSSFLTVNEKREILGYKKIAGGEHLYTQ